MILLFDSLKEFGALLILDYSPSCRYVTLTAILWIVRALPSSFAIDASNTSQVIPCWSHGPRQLTIRNRASLRAERDSGALGRSSFKCLTVARQWQKRINRCRAWGTHQTLLQRQTLQRLVPAASSVLSLSLLPPIWWTSDCLWAYS